MKVGDLVRYKGYHNTLKDTIGVVVKVNSDRNACGDIQFPTVRVLWAAERPHGPALDWMDELEVISESR